MGLTTGVRLKRIPVEQMFKIKFVRADPPPENSHVCLKHQWLGWMPLKPHQNVRFSGEEKNSVKNASLLRR